MNRIEIRALIQERNEWCVSIIVPTHRTSPDRRVDTEVIQKSIQLAKSILRGKNAPAEVYRLISDSLEQLYKDFDPVHSLDGIGLFVSPEMARMVQFPFAVKEKIIVDNSFEVRDLYYLEQFAKPYYLLNLTKDEAHLFALETGAAAREVTNTIFPMRNTYEYEYSKPSLGTSFGFARKAFEKDKSVMEKVRQEPFYKEVARHVMPYTKAGDLLISGSKNILSLFDASRDKHLRVKGRITGSYKEDNELFERARQTYFECRQSEIQLLLDSLAELIGKKRVAYGIRNVWAAAVAGKGDTLLVEKELKEEGYALPEGKLVSVPDSTVYRTVKTEKVDHIDKVDHIIDTILDKGGKVIFTEENQLENYDRIALILRY